MKRGPQPLVWPVSRLTPESLTTMMPDRMRRHRSVSVLLLWLLVRGSAAHAESIDVSAALIEVDLNRSNAIVAHELTFESPLLKGAAKQGTFFREDQKLVLKDDVRILVQGFVIDADEAEIDTRDQTVRFEHLKLEADMRLRPPVFMSAEKGSCANGSCTAYHLSGTACPHQPQGWHVTASHADIDADGDLDLTWPVLYVGDLPVLALPWIELRTERKPGLLAPRLGWSEPAGLIIGPAAWFPLGDEASLTLDVAGRTRQGAEAGATLSSGRNSLSGRYIYDDPEHRGMVQGEGGSSLPGGDVGARVEYATDGFLPAELAATMPDIARARLENRARVSLGREMVWVETDASLVGLRNEEDPWAGHVGQRLASLRMEIGPEPIASGPLLAGIGLSMRRFGTLYGDTMAVSPEGYIPPLTRMAIQPRLDLGGFAGPFTIDASGGTRHVFYLMDGVDDLASESRDRHMVWAGLDIGLPLFRNYASVRHEITPLLRVKAAPWTSEEALAVLDDLDRFERGLAAEVGVSQVLEPLNRSLQGRIDLFQRVLWPAFDEAAPLVSLEAAFDSSFLRGRGRVSMAEEEPLLSEGEADIGVTGLKYVMLNLRYLYLVRGESLLALEDMGAYDFLFGSILNAQGEIHYAGGDVEVPIAWGLRALGEVHAGISDEVLYGFGYGLGYGPKCGCADVALRAFHRYGRTEPDLWLTLDLKGI